MPVAYSHLASYFRISRDSHAQLLFPGRNHVPPGCYGYVRATHVAPRSWWHTIKGDPKPVPFRDYEEPVRTPIVNLFPAPYQTSRVVISARNVLNEWPYQARIGGQWFRRHGDPDVPRHFPVVAVTSDGLAMCPLAEAPETGDILTGLPLVINSKPMHRSFLVANSSDVAHSYECHPEGSKYFGPDVPAWQEISDKWHSEFEEWVRDPKRTPTQRARSIDTVAARFSRWPKSHDSGADLTHSVIVDTGDDNVYTMVLTGTLWSIAAFLQSHGALSALVLDQSGSVNYCYLEKKALAPQSVISTTNWRDKGTCFLAIDTGGYVSQVQHIWMPRSG